MSMPSLLMFTRDIQSKVSKICDCTFGLKGTMEKVKYQYRPNNKIKRVRLRAVKAIDELNENPECIDYEDLNRRLAND